MRWSLAIALLAGVCLAQDATTTSDTPTSSSIDLADASTVTPTSIPAPSGTYETYSTTITFGNGESSVMVSSTLYGNASATATGNGTILTTSSDSLTVLGGTKAPNATASSTAASHTPVVNTQPCNGWPEFCNRKYSNITMVAAHNSPFVRAGSAASNQALDVTTQLDDGIRMLQFQTHYQNGTMMLCHTSCELLDVGTLEAYLTKVYAWMAKHPYDVVTILMGNFDFVSPQNFTDPIEKSGMKQFAYSPPKFPMALDDWPTLSELILTGKRALFFMDYNANETAIPWLMDEFSQIWETPFSPTDRAFPCTEQRPPGLSHKQAKDRMYMANHNLNLEMNLGTVSMLIPNTALIQETNGVSGFGSLGVAAENCTATWGRPPNFLLVDYYNLGSPHNGSVFDVAAEMNNVTYDWSRCCGKRSAAVPGMSVTSVSTVLAVAAGVQFLLSVF